MNLHRKHMFLASILMAFVLILSACGTDEPEVVTEGVVVEGDTAAGVVVEETPVIVDEEVITDTEVDVDTEADVETDTDVETSTEVETGVIVDTDVITQTEVFTETDVTEVITETEVITDVNVMTDTATVQDSSTQTEQADVDTSAAVVLILFTDTAGNRFLADEEGQPIFAYTGTGTPPVATQDFQPLQDNGNIVVGEGLDATMFVADPESDINQLTYNDLFLYRFIGTGDPMQLAADQDLSPLTIDE